MGITSIIIILVGLLAIIALIALLQARTDGNATQAEAVSLEIGTVTYHLEPDEWQQLRRYLTAEGLNAIRVLDQARESLRAAERKGDATQVARAQASFDFWATEVYRAYQRVALAWFSTHEGKQWLALHNLPIPSKE